VPKTVELIPVAENSVAVLKMTNLDGSDETDVFSKGLSEDILNRVARVPGLLVSARGDSWSLPENAPSELVRRRLRVAFYLESSVRIEDGLITVVAQFIDSSNGFHIFSRTFEVELAKFRGIQREITGLIVSEMRVALPEDMQDTIAPPMDDTQINAYVQYRRGKDILDLPQTAETINQAAGFFQTALEIDPLYAAAHAGLCGSFTASYQLEGATSEIVAAEQACGAALDAAPRLPLVHRATGNLYFLTSRLAESDSSYQDALAFNEQDAEAMLGLARVYRRQQRIEEAEKLIMRAIELQPGNWRAYNRLGTLQYTLGQYDDAAETYRKAVVPGSG
jgi:adenylate cyclase